MDILEQVKNDKKIKDFFYRFCDFDPYDDYMQTLDLNGEMKFNMNNKAFGMAGDGTEFVLLEDGTVAMSGSEGDVGRIAESMEEFLALLLNFPCFWDFMCYRVYLDENKDKFRLKLSDAMSEMSEDNEFEILRFETAEKLGISIDTDVVSNTAIRFFNTVTRQPRFGYYFEDAFYDELFSDYCFWC